MKRRWTEEELIERWTLMPNELPLLSNKSGHTRLGFAVLLRFFAGEGRFPRSKGEVAGVVVAHLAKQVGVAAEGYTRYDWRGRAIKYHRAEVRGFFGFREATGRDAEELARWLVEEVLPYERNPERVEEAFYARCRSLRLEPPTSGRAKHLIASARTTHEERFSDSVFGSLTEASLRAMDALLDTNAPAYSDHGSTDGEVESSPDAGRSALAWIKSDPGRPGLESVLEEVEKLRLVGAQGIPTELFSGTSPGLVKEYRQRAATEAPSELRAHKDPVRATLLAALLWSRGREITDSLVELLTQVVHRIGARAERRVEREILNDFRRVTGKTKILFRLAEAAVESPEGVVREVLYPVVGEHTLKDLIKEFKSTGPAYRLHVHSHLRASYGSHYRRMVPRLLEALEFHSNNAAHRPIIEALSLLRSYAGSSARAYATYDDVPLDGVVPPGWRELVVTAEGKGRKRVDRIGYEVCVLNALRGALRRREVWVVGADRYRDPDEDLPRDFEERREAYYEELDQPLEAERFVEALREEMRDGLEALEQGLPKNPSVRISEAKNGWISLSPLPAQPKPPTLGSLRAEVSSRWPMTSLLDVLKEADLRTNLTALFATSATREALPNGVLRKRLLLCLYGLGTNTGLKRVGAGDPDGSTHQDLRYVRRKYVTREYLRSAIAHLANAVFRVRRSEIWGEGTTACASDSKKFGAWDQNLLTEWSIRHRGRGVMIYWHVERKSVCVYSQLKSVSSSEVAAMIEGILRHCTDMTIERNYVDSHGQSEVAFGFARLLGFELLPRLKSVGRQRLYRPDTGDPAAYPSLAPVLTRPIDWKLIRRQYDQMVKYATALRLGTADAESILRRFARGPSGGAPMHPTYRALAELGKAVKTVFLCRYLREEALRREIHEGLNTIESWNGANSFIFYGKGGEIATNRLEEQETSVLALHLLQMALVYVNTLMIQRVLAGQAWQGRLTPRDLRGLTPLIFAHVNPYGTFELDMEKRIPLEGESVA